MMYACTMPFHYKLQKVIQLLPHHSGNYFKDRTMIGIRKKEKFCFETDQGIRWKCTVSHAELDLPTATGK